MERQNLLRSREYWITTIQAGLFEMMEKYRRDHGMNKTQLATQLGVTKGYVSQILNGDFDHKISKMVDTSLALGKVPIIRYEDLDKFILHDALNISTKIGFVREVDIDADLCTPIVNEITSFNVRTSSYTLTDEAEKDTKEPCFA